MGEDRPVAAQLVRVRQQAGAGQQEQRFDQRPVRDDRAHRAGPPLGRDHAGPGSGGDGFGGEPGLADAGLAGDEDRPAPP